IIIGKIVYTVDDSFSKTEAIAIDKGKVLETGTAEYRKGRYTAAEVINAAENYIYPGFIDDHCHFRAYGLDLYKCCLIGTSSFDEVLNKLNAYEQENKLPWIYGRGWDQNDWENKEFPTKEKLDAYFSKPVILKRIDGHAVLCNQLALDKAGININTKIEGGI